MAEVDSVVDNVDQPFLDIAALFLWGRPQIIKLWVCRFRPAHVCLPFNWKMGPIKKMNMA